MSHGDAVTIDIHEALEAEPLGFEIGIKRLLIWMVVVGAFTFIYGYVAVSQELFWGAYYTNLCFWMGLAAGASMIPAMLQIVRATWAAPIRRLAEANVAFLPYAFVFFLVTYLGRHSLFPWAREPMPGREWWMQPEFVYLRFAVLLGLLFFLMCRFVRMGLRTDIGFIREHSRNRQRWLGWQYDGVAADWQGAEKEIPETQNRLSWNAPVLVFVYAVVYSLFSFEMIMGMDTVWYSNMFGGFIFVGNIYLGFAAVNLLSCFLTSRFPQLDKIVRKQQRWDLGKLTLGFCMLWGYMFFSQFLPQWYGNLPEETQWMILRTREYPWKAWSWVVFSMCFVVPFLLCASEDIKKVRSTFAILGLIVFCGLWLEKYVIIMPQLSPAVVPFGIIEVGLFFGFLGLYGLSVLSFLARYPYVPLSSPLSQGVTKW